jgi:hypothetical protein
MEKEPKVVYWIQDQAPDGGYVDSIGMPGRLKEDAVKQYKLWQATFPSTNPRLIARIDIPLL